MIRSNPNNRHIYLKDLVSKKKSKKGDKSLYLRGSELVRELEESGPKHFGSDSESLKFILNSFGLLSPRMAQEKNLSFDDLMSGYVFQNDPKYSLGDVLVLRNRPLGEIDKVQDLHVNIQR